MYPLRMACGQHRLLCVSRQFLSFRQRDFGEFAFTHALECEEPRQSPRTLVTPLCHRACQHFFFSSAWCSVERCRRRGGGAPKAPTIDPANGLEGGGTHKHPHTHTHRHTHTQRLVRDESALTSSIAHSNKAKVEASVRTRLWLIHLKDYQWKPAPLKDFFCWVSQKGVSMSEMKAFLFYFFLLQTANPLSALSELPKIWLISTYRSL